MRITAADGTTWVVRRRPGRAPRWVQFGRRPASPVPGVEMPVRYDGVSEAQAGAGYQLVLLIGKIVFGVLVPAMLYLADAVLLAVTLLLFAGPWRVEAFATETPRDRLRWRIRGLRKSRRAVRDVAGQLRVGLKPDPEGQEP
jgi:hypothetical protein